jgi:apolipoprotein N-acyltransferase
VIPARARSERAREAARAAWLLLAGVIGAWAVREPGLFVLGWVAVAMIGWGLARWKATWITLLGLLLGESVGVWVALYWATAGFEAAGGAGWLWLAGPPATLIWAGLSRAPLMLAWRLLGSRLPVWAWLPAAWALGEAWLEAAIGLQNDAWLFGQWQAEPVLRALAIAGWVPTLLACLTLFSAVGATIAGSRAAAGVAAVLIAVGFALPARPPRPPGILETVGAVHLNALEQAPETVPDGLSVLVWPEQITERRTRIAEGPNRGARRLRMPAMKPGMHQLVGSAVHADEGELNAVIALAPDGRVIAVRGKRRLFPLVERPLFGWMAPGAVRFKTGRAPTHFDLGTTRVGSLVCLESFDRALMHEVRASGAALMAISANDELLGGSADGDRQMLGLTVLRAVESHVPIARASLHGRASLVGADGRVWAWSPRGSNGVLRLADGEPKDR